MGIMLIIRMDSVKNAYNHVRIVYHKPDVYLVLIQNYINIKIIVMNIVPKAFMVLMKCIVKNVILLVKHVY